MFRLMKTAFGAEPDSDNVSLKCPSPSLYSEVSVIFNSFLIFAKNILVWCAAVQRYTERCVIPSRFGIENSSLK